MAMRQIWLVAWIASVLAGLPVMATAAPGRWDQPAGALAEQIAGILGPGQAQLSIRNLSTIAAGEVPSIRRLLEQDLKGHGVLISGAESANTIRITLSESERDRVWVAEIVQGNETRVAMVEAPLEAARASAVEQRILLRKEKISRRGRVFATWGARAGGARDERRTGGAGARGDFVFCADRGRMEATEELSDWAATSPGA